MSKIKEGKWTNKNLQNTTQKTKDRLDINMLQEQWKSNKEVVTNIGSTILIILHLLIEVPEPSHESETSCIC
jgi:hypothetical protein